jgi:hypothetical protein
MIQPTYTERDCTAYAAAGVLDVGVLAILVMVRQLTSLLWCIYQHPMLITRKRYSLLCLMAILSKEGVYLTISTTRFIFSSSIKLVGLPG